MPLPSFFVECLSNDVIAKDVHEIRFRKPEGFTFLAGQYVMFDAPLIADESDVQVRAYSIASTPAEDDLLFVIKRVENGRMSAWIKDALKPGGMMRMQGPLGVFGTKPTEKDMLFVCTSTGNAPFRSIIKHKLENGETKRMDLIFGVRTREDLFWTEEFAEMARKYDNFFFHPAVTQPDADWKGHTGRVQTLFRSVCCNLHERTVYACGNPAMTTEVKELCLGHLNMEKKDVHIEGYI